MDAPYRFLDTQKIADDTYVVRQLIGEGHGPVAVPMNSMVITGAEPVIVDCGPAVTRAEWLERTFALVDPADVRWIFLSHDDVDHTGNLLQVLDLCPAATLVTNWFSVERMSADHQLPLERMRWVNDGESFVAGDRELVAVVPPTFDSPTTRGLFDTSTGVYWAADSFGTPVTHAVDDVAELDRDFYRSAVPMFNTMLSPWARWLDPTRYGAHIDRIAALGATVATGGHAVTLKGDQVRENLELIRTIPSAPPAPLPGQAELDQIVAAMTAPPMAA